MKLTQVFVFCAAMTVCAVQAQTAQTTQPKVTQSQTTQPKLTQSQTAVPKVTQSPTPLPKAAQQTPRPQVSDTALEDALSDKRFIQRQLKCALGEAPCDPIGKRLKTLAPLVLRGACPQCTPQETRQIQRTLSYVQRNYPQQWAKIVRQYAG